MKDAITLSPKHALNPSMLICFLCQKDMGVALCGRLPGDKEAPREMCLPGSDPCDACQELMKAGVIMISVDEERSKDSPQNPYRTGGWVAVRDEAVKRLIHTPEMVERILKQRVAFVPDNVWDALGLPRVAADAETEETQP